jgi:hypothetical protein
MWGIMWDRSEWRWQLTLRARAWIHRRHWFVGWRLKRRIKRIRQEVEGRRAWTVEEPTSPAVRGFLDKVTVAVPEIAPTLETHQAENDGDVLEYMALGRLFKEFTRLSGSDKERTVSSPADPSLVVRFMGAMEDGLRSCHPAVVNLIDVEIAEELDRMPAGVGRDMLLSKVGPLLKSVLSTEESQTAQTSGSDGSLAGIIRCEVARGDALWTGRVFGMFARLLSRVPELVPVYEREYASMMVVPDHLMFVFATCMHDCPRQAVVTRFLDVLDEEWRTRDFTVQAVIRRSFLYYLRFSLDHPLRRQLGGDLAKAVPPGP